MADEMKNPGGDAWLEILKRVPAETLGQCMCVCKAWYSLILSPHFIAAHALTQSQTLQILLRDFTKPNGGHEIYRLFSDDPEKGSLETRRSFLCPFESSRGPYLRVVGAVNGLLCLSDDIFGYAYTFFLWNPTVRKGLTLPKPRVTFDLVGAYMFVLGFGYDSVRADYKLVRMSYPQDREGLDETPPMVELYSVKEGAWRFVSSESARNLEYCIPEKGWFQCFLRGSAHWAAYDRRETDRGFKSDLVLLFDFEQEKFKRMKLPSPLVYVCPLSLCVCEFRGLLSVNHLHRSEGFLGDLASVDMWVKKQYNDGNSWSKMFSIDGTTGIQRLLHPIGNGEMLAATTDDLVCYNNETKEMVDLGGHGNLSSYYACSFTETLVFLEHGSPAVSCEEYHEQTRFVPGAANVEKEDETGDSSSSSSSDSQVVSSEGLKWMKRMGPISALLYQMMKFKQEF